MKTKLKNWMGAIMMVGSLFILAACDNSEKVIGTGQVEFEITDAPIDDAQVKGVLVTVSDVKVNGKSIAGFSGKQTIDLKAHQEGLTKLLGTAELDAKTYSSLTLVLDLNEDQNGNSPGCYVLATDNAKYQLATTASGTTEIALNKAWTVRNNAKTRVVMDVDLRKAIRYDENTSIRYAFVSPSELQASVRVVTREGTGTIKGTFDGDFDSNTEQVVVYAYKKGTFNANSETQYQDGIQFRNAVNSTKIKAGLVSNSYTLAFMEEGEYELVFAAYSKNQNSGRYVLDGMINADLEVNGSLSNIIKVKAGVSLTVSASARTS